VSGEDAMVTVLFVDIRDFTRFADAAPAREAVALLDEFFGVRPREQVDLAVPGAKLREAVGETMQPAHVSLWLRAER
jgi:hypothetical protein